MAGGPLSAVLDFGAGSDTASVVIIGQSDISSTSAIEAWVDATGGDALAPDLHSADEHLAEQLRVLVQTIVPGTGFTIVGICDSGPTTGKYNVKWVWV